MRIELSLTHTGQPIKLTTAPIDLVAFERQYGTGVAKAFTFENMRFEHQLWLAWYSLHRRKLTTDDFDTWMVGVEEFGDPEQVPVVPLDETPNTG